MLRLIDIRFTATSALPSDVANDNCVQDALCRLREALALTDRVARLREVDPAPEDLIKARRNLLAWIAEARRQNARLHR